MAQVILSRHPRSLLSITRSVLGALFLSECLSRLRQILLEQRILSAAVIASLLAAVYWLGIASDRYVSEAKVIIQQTNLSGGEGMNLSSLLGGAPSNRADQLLLREHLLSVDMLNKLDASLQLRTHYSQSSLDLISRMWAQDNPMEWFHRYYLSRVSIEFDEYSGVLLIKGQGFDAKTAHAITTKLVKEGERFMNSLANGLAQEQVTFLDTQVALMSQRAMQTRQAVLRFQNNAGLVSPQATVQNFSSIVATLEGQLATLETQRRSSQAYLVPGHPSIVQLNQQISAVQQQIDQEKAKLTSTGGKTLNRTVEEFQRLEMEVAFAQDVYKTGLAALEQGRLEAIRTIKKVSVLQSPTMPERSMEPLRYYNTLVFLLAALLLAGIAHLLLAIVRDHKD